MNHRKRLLLTGTVFASWAIALVAGLIIMFSYPDKTRVRLFLDYWQIWLLIYCTYGFGLWVIKVVNRDN